MGALFGWACMVGEFARFGGMYGGRREAETRNNSNEQLAMSNEQKQNG